MSRRLLDTLLGLDRFRELGRAFAEESRRDYTPRVTAWSALVAVALSLIPALSFYLPPIEGPDPVTVAVGITTLCAVVYRLQHRLVVQSKVAWRRSLRLTHSAFAAGCIPFVFLLLLFPHEFALIGERAAGGGAPTGAAPSLLERMQFLVEVALWAGVTEEFIYRGMLLSLLRRALPQRNGRARDLTAVGLSAFLFAIAHYPAWGFYLSLSLFGLGAGLGLAYVAIGEQLLPLIVYHVIFDLVSLVASSL